MENSSTILFPEMFGENSGRITKWYFKEGDKVKSGDILADVDIETATMELENYESGTVLHIAVKEDEIVYVGQLLMIIGEKGMDIDPIIENAHQVFLDIQAERFAMEGYVGEIRMFAGEKIPVKWKVCDGSELKVEDYRGLFKVLGSKYGGDGHSTFNLPALEAMNGVQYIICVQGAPPI